VCWYWDGSLVSGPDAPPPSVDGTEGTASAIAVGDSHMCAIQAGSGEVVCWGSIEFYGVSVDMEGTYGTASAIAAGRFHSCGIRAGSGAVECWGYDWGGLTPPPAVDGTEGAASAIAVGGDFCGEFCVSQFSCAIQAGTGAVVCWGIGAGAPPPSVNGTEGSASAISVGKGGTHACAIQTGTGAVVCWVLRSWYDWGQVTPPPSVDGTAGAASAVATGWDHTLAIRVPACSDGIDNDGDGLIDYVVAGGGDPGCASSTSPGENPQCQDGLNNDNQPGIDFDGGASLDLDQDGFIDAQFHSATPPVGAADPQCVGKPWKYREAASSCGLGCELVLLTPLLSAFARRRRGATHDHGLHG
jgi:hypothetical protein